MSVDKRIGVHFTSASDKGVIILLCVFFVFFFVHAFASHVKHPGQDAGAGGRHVSLHIFANCRQSVK